MPALVPELVNTAVDTSIPAADLLRRALVVARRLDVPDLVEWINCELNGYRDGHALPEYRQVRGELKAENPMRGPIPLYAPPEITAAVTLTPVFQSLPELMHLAKSKHGVFAHFAPESLVRA